MKVRCINNSGYGESKVSLVVGQVYEVEKVIGTVHGVEDYKLVGVPYSWSRCRFEVVPEQPTTFASTATSTSTTDSEEEKLWQLMRPATPPGYCPCGIHRDQCDYHR